MENIGNVVAHCRRDVDENGESMLLVAALVKPRNGSLIPVEENQLLGNTSAYPI